MFNLIYQPILALFGILYLPHFFKRLRQEPQKKKFFRERLGHYTLNLDSGPVVWIHAVSVGEVLAAKEFIKLLSESMRELQIVISTTTPTGQEIARGLQGPKIHAIYFPFDFTGAVKRAFNAINPICVIMMETEIWPNVIVEASRRNIPIGIINGRISDRAVNRYRLARPIFAPLLSKLSFCFACSEKDKERFRELGVKIHRIHATGNMKFDQETKKKEENGEALKVEWQLEDNKIFVGGSTHEGEEEILISTFKMLRREFPGLKLILAPRHTERSVKIVDLVRRNEFTVALVSQGFQAETDVLILDQMGVLSKYYAIADAIFVGGSLVKHGGQNPIEPAREFKAIMHGPFVANFQEVYERLNEANGAFCVNNESSLYQKTVSLLSDPREFERSGRAAFEVVEALKGATKRNIELIKPLLSEKVRKS